MPSARFPLVLATTALLAGCTAAPESSTKSKEESKKARAVAIAKTKLAHARLEAEVDRAKRLDAIDQATKELSLADDALQDFQEKEAPLKVRKAALEVKEKTASLIENQEELKQLEMMYAEQDLADQTREMVLQRTKRRIEQSEAELALARDELTHLQEDEIVIELAKLRLEVSEKQKARDAAERDARVAASEKAVEGMEAEAALADAESGDEGHGAAASEEEDEGDED